MSNLDPKYVHASMVPGLTTEERLRYLGQEIDRVQEMLDGAEDCKWVYLALIDLSTLYHNQRQKWPAQVDLWRMIDKIQLLDPLRAGRWADLKNNLQRL